MYYLMFPRDLKAWPALTSDGDGRLYLGCKNVINLPSDWSKMKNGQIHLLIEYLLFKSLGW